MKCIFINILTLFLLFSNPCFTQTDTESNYFDAGLIFGYRSPLGYFGVKMGYHPNILNRKINLNAGLGVTRLQARFGCGTYICLLKKREFNPYIGTEYAIGFTSEIIANTQSGKEYYHIGFHQYFAPLAGMKIGVLNKTGWILIQGGYSFLLNSVEVTSTYGASTQQSVYVNELKSSPFISVGFMLDFDFNNVNPE